MTTAYTSSGLGRAVNKIRETRGITQAEVAEKAGYRTGGAVAISRVENGRQRPTPERLAGIAEALDLPLKELEAKAVHESKESDDLGDRDVPPSAKELRRRATQLQSEIDRRTQVVESHVEAFDAEHTRAQEDFFMRFVKVADRIDGAELQVEVAPKSEGDQVAGKVAENRLGMASNGIAKLLAGSAGGGAAGAVAGGGLAYGTFVTAASLGTASTGAAISGLSGVAATNATLALLGGGTLAAGGAGMARGIAVLAGVVAFPMTVLAAGGVLLISKRNQRQRREFDEKLRHAEQDLTASKDAFESFVKALSSGSELLNYIATHGGHALNRWSGQRSADRYAWDDMSVDDRARYQGFVEVAAAQISIATVDYQQLLSSRGVELDELKEVVGELLQRAGDSVRAHV